jgi:hypothetical protein
MNAWNAPPPLYVIPPPRAALANLIQTLRVEQQPDNVRIDMLYVV